MPDTIPRPVVALSVIVAVVAIFLGIKDYVEQRKAKPAATASTPTVIHSDATIKSKKNTSAKSRRARTSPTEANARATAQAATGGAEISEEFANAGASAIAVLDNAANSARTQDTDDHAGMVRTDRVRNAYAGDHACPAWPLPNLTKPGDVDVVYYRNWAREYSCLI